MCVPNNVFEKQAFLIFEKMADSTIYKPVKLELNEGNILSFERWKTASPQQSMMLIKNVIVEDQNGRQFSVQPDEAGLKFVTGEVTYKEYEQIKAKDTRKVFLIFSAAISLIVGAGIAMTNFI